MYPLNDNNQKLIITGGNPLVGEIEATGAKNAMTKLLVASLLSDKKCIFYNVPNIGDVEITVALCKEIGMEVQWDREKKILEVITKEIKSSKIPQTFSGANRIPILLIGALLGRANEDIIVPTVGGDQLGKRPLNFHIAALEKLGAVIEFNEHECSYFAKAKNGLKGTTIQLNYPSVGATENTILAAIRAKGKTIIKNAAIEPEIIDLILFLQKLGADISFSSDRCIIIENTKTFYEVSHNVLSDRNEVASYAMAAISTKGNVFIKKAKHLHMVAFLNKIRKIGGGFSIYDDGIKFFYKDKLKGNILIETNVHPGFMTDWQQPFGVLLTQCEGESIIHETVYENRFGYTKILKEMGADIELFSSCLGNTICRFKNNNHFHSIKVNGPTPLKAMEFSIPDLRAGFAYVMAALIAKEKSTIYGVPFLERGYENIVGKLQKLGANIEKAN